MEKIKDTKLGAWLKVKGSRHFKPRRRPFTRQGGLGIVKNLLDKEEDVDPAEAKAKVDAEIHFQKNVNRNGGRQT